MSAHLTHAQRVAALNATYDAHPPRPAQGSRAAVDAMKRAATLAGLVRDEGPDTIGAYLDDLDRAQLYAIAVTLAAAVDVDQPLADALGWLEPIGRRMEYDALNATRRAARAAAADEEAVA